MYNLYEVVKYIIVYVYTGVFKISNLHTFNLRRNYFYLYVYVPTLRHTYTLLFT